MNLTLAAFGIAVVIGCIAVFVGLAFNPDLLVKGWDRVAPAVEWGKRAPGWLLAAFIASPFLARHWARAAPSWLRSHRPHLPRRPERVRGGKHALRAEVAR